MFTNKKLATTAADLTVQIDDIVETFTTTVASLEKKATEAQKAMEEKKAQIELLEIECGALGEVNARAKSIAEKIANLLN